MKDEFSLNNFIKRSNCPKIRLTAEFFFDDLNSNSDLHDGDEEVGVREVLLSEGGKEAEAGAEADDEAAGDS